MKYLIKLAFCGIVIFFYSSVANAEDKEFDWNYENKKIVRSMLKDPKSAEFRNVYFNRANLGGKTVPITCGEVNSKNSFGGYSGFTRFVSAGSAMTVLEDQVKDFHKVWNKLCVK